MGDFDFDEETEFDPLHEQNDAKIPLPRTEASPSVLLHAPVRNYLSFHPVPH